LWSFMGLVITLAGYGAYTVFCWRIVARMLTWAKAPVGHEVARRTTCPSVVMSVLDVLFLRKLFAVNKLLWVGEWLFHVSFVVVIVRHLRYFLLPVPGWISVLQGAGVWAGYVLTGSLAYIFVVRYVVQRTVYKSRENLPVTLLFTGIGILGLLMRWVAPPDLIQVKSFVMGGLGFSPGTLPENIALLLHILLVIAVLPFLPTHIMTAPLTVYDAERRAAGLETVLHDG